MRAAFDQELTELQAGLVELGAMVQTQLDHALAVLATGNVNAIQGIVAGDQQINQLSAEIDWALLRTMARQAPVASDLRLVAGLLHVNEHLERMGDLCVIPEGAGTVNPYDEDRPGVVCRSLPAGEQPSARRRGQRWSARSAARTNDLGTVQG
jgi:PhoU domain